MNSDKSISELRVILKTKLKSIMNTDITNISTGITARMAITGINKMSSGKAIEKSLKNEFSVEAHFSAAQDIKNLFEKSELPLGGRLIKSTERLSIKTARPQETLGKIYSKTIFLSSEFL